jgi:hypothetical protein
MSCKKYLTHKHISTIEIGLQFIDNDNIQSIIQKPIIVCLIL